jgi:Fe-S cluster biogenesis protein NfuA
MVTPETVETILGRVRPYLVADGGDVELVAIDGANVRVRLTGACAGCPSSHLTLSMGIETALREAMSDFGQLEVV